MTLSRRALLAAAAAVAAMPAAAAGPPPMRVAALDWGLAQTLLAMGLPPVAVPETAAYDFWTGGAALPAGVVDLGLRVEPNRELLQRLAPDLIVATDEHALLVPQLRRIAPVLSLSIYTGERTPWLLASAATRRLGAAVDRPDAAEAVVAAAEARFAEGRRVFRGDRRPVVVASFMDPRHVRVYGRSSLAADVLAHMGLTQGWPGETNFWGFATLPLEALAQVPEARLVVVEPFPAGVREGLASSRLWQGLPMVRAGRVSIVARTMMFGMVPAAERFAALLTAEAQA